MEKAKEEMLLIKSLAPMLKTVFELFSPDLLKAKPESEAVRRQANILSAYIYNSPLGLFLKDMLTMPELARIVYNFKQEDFNKLYEVIDDMRGDKK